MDIQKMLEEYRECVDIGNYYSIFDLFNNPVDCRTSQSASSILGAFDKFRAPHAVIQCIYSGSAPLRPV